MDNVLLSVIMPCYNVEKTFSRAIESVLMQRVDFNYEIIIVNDASTDSSAAVFEKYEKEHSNIHVYHNEKNVGNAETFFQGLSRASGDFFCVLDGDDFYTIQDKFQRQIDFFRTDIDEEYVAVAHRYIYVNSEKACISGWPEKTEFNYLDLLTQNTGGYYHTSTYMYRNIFRGNVPAFFRDDALRGDTPRTFFHLMYSNKKVKVLPFVGSAYFYSYDGIWSGMDKAKQNERSIRMWSRIKEIVDSTFEKKQVDKLIKKFETSNDKEENEYRTYNFLPYDYHIEQIQKRTKNYAFRSDAMVFKNAYFDVYLDTLLVSLGYSYRAFHTEYIQTVANDDTILLLCGKLVPHGGGIFKEIIEIIQMYEDKDFHVLLTDCNEVSDEVIEELSKAGCRNVHYAPEGCDSALKFYLDTLVTISPKKVYFYAAHDNPYVPALLQSGVAKNILIFSFDHGYICGLDNPNTDVVIAKRASDYNLLKTHFGDRAILVPTWSMHVSHEKQQKYSPYKSHKNLITASAAARYYKVDGSGKNSYVRLISELLSKTKGTHYHFGVIPDDKKEMINEILSEYGVPKSSFINIEWVDSLQEAMLENEIDVFVEPFPTISYKISLDVMSVGVPIIGYDGTTRLKNLDFLYDGYMKWKTPEEFINTLLNANDVLLLDQSRKAVEYYNAYHDVEVVKPYFVNEKNFDYPNKRDCTDNVFGNITEFKQLYDMPKTELPNRKEKSMEQAQRLSAKEKIEEIKSSFAYKVGYAITFIPWKVKSLFKKRLPNERHCHPWDDLSNDDTQNEYLLQLLYGSTTLRVGQAITKPFTRKNKKNVKGKQLLKRLVYQQNRTNDKIDYLCKETSEIKHEQMEMLAHIIALETLIGKNNEINSEILSAIRENKC